MAREFELKYAAAPEILQQIRGQFGDFSMILMETIYYDTPQRTLSAQKMTLRLRQENDISVCTLKTPLPDGSRGEWECEAPSITAGLEKLILMGAPVIVHAVEPVCGARFTRLCKHIPTGESSAELALDEGILLGGGKELPLCEVEVEHKSGAESATAAFAKTLAAQYGLREESMSKFQRAASLAEGE